MNRLNVKKMIMEINKRILIFVFLLISYTNCEIWKYVWDDSANSFVWKCCIENNNTLNNTTTSSLFTPSSHLAIASTSSSSSGGSAFPSSSSTTSVGVGTPNLVQRCSFCNFVERKTLVTQLNTSFPKKKFNSYFVRRFNFKRLKLNNFNMNDNSTTTITNDTTTISPSLSLPALDVKTLRDLSTLYGNMSKFVNKKNRRKNKPRTDNSQSKSNVKNKSTNTEKLVHFCSNCGLLTVNSNSTIKSLSNSKIRRLNKKFNITSTTANSLITSTTTISSSTTRQPTPQLYQNAIVYTHLELKRRKKGVLTR